LKKELDQLPKTFDGIEARQESDWGSGRTGVFEISTFYKRFIGFDRVPETLREWRMIPETHLAAATNGKVFTDPLGEFTVFRNKLKALYPEDIRLKKIASRCMTMAQSGQYNYMRCVKRGEFVAAQQAEAQFIDHTISMIFLLNKAFKPFYKWMHRAMQKLPILGETIFNLLSDMARAHERVSGTGVYKEKSRLLEDICKRIITELRMMELSGSHSEFLLDHGPMVQNRIEDPQIRALDVWIE
jgi:Domain of unknown function (DUF4037)